MIFKAALLWIMWKGETLLLLSSWCAVWRHAYHCLELRYKHAIMRWWRKSRSSYLVSAGGEAWGCCRRPAVSASDPCGSSGLLWSTSPCALKWLVFFFGSKSTLLIFTSPYGELGSAVLYVICMLLSFDRRNHPMVLCFSVKCCVGCYNNLINIQIHSAIPV